MFPAFLARAAALLLLTSTVLATPQQFSSAASVPSVTQAAPPSSTQQACNNSPELCNRNYNNITHLGGHNAAFVRDRSTGFTISGNQYYNATVALSAGVRLLSAQVHLNNGTIRLCHSSCTLLDAGLLETWLGEIKRWMDSNPREVVTLVLVNSDDLTAAQYGAIYTSTGISTYGYVPSATPQTTWPTLQTMITSNKRLVTFIASIDASSTYPYLLPEFSYMFETAFGVTEQTGFNCTLHRPPSLSSASAALSAGYMGMINFWLDDAQSFFQAPNVALLTTTNSANVGTQGTLGTQANQCRSEWGVKPTFLLVNFFNVGPAIDTVDAMNGVSGSVTGRIALSQAILTQSSTGSSHFMTGKGMVALASLALGVVGLGQFIWA